SAHSVERLFFIACALILMLALPLCQRAQQCTIERRGFRQDLDSWRHKLIHCVGFESILEGLFGSRLVEDLTLFKGESVCCTDTQTNITSAN
uniref:Uncharacterized protein n=1 Tax=Oncorhynchus mykiss TaxID=8022 RepID=A0A8K9V7N6_ONCMY